MFVFFIHLEMEEHTKEVEHDLRQNIDLLQSRLHEVESSSFKNLHLFSSPPPERTSNRTASIHYR